MTDDTVIKAAEMICSALNSLGWDILCGALIIAFLGGGSK
jgi:hypothetical protein